MYKVIQSPGKLLYVGEGHDRYYVDQLQSDPKLLRHCSKFSNYLWSIYKLTLQQYYNLVIYGDINYIPMCPTCGENPLPFINLKVGYWGHCSKSCQVTDKNYQCWQDPTYYEYMYNILNSYEAKSLASRNYLINHAGDWNLYYYIGTYDDPNLTDYFKLGATIYDDLTGREAFKLNCSVHDLQMICTGDATSIAELEYQVKLRYAKDNYPLTGKQEAFKLIQKDEILQFINDYIESSETIERITNN